MIEISELWIGDMLMSTKSGKIGTYVGLHTDGNKLRVKVGDKIVFMYPHSVVLYVEKTTQVLIEKKDKKYKPIDKFGDIIDLHINKLNPEMEHANPIHIIEYQIRQCRAFVESCIRKLRMEAIIIHGIGTGQLKHDVLHLLGDYKEVKFVDEINQGGAQKISFYYY